MSLCNQTGGIHKHLFTLRHFAGLLRDPLLGQPIHRLGMCRHSLEVGSITKHTRKLTLNLESLGRIIRFMALILRRDFFSLGDKFLPDSALDRYRPGELGGLSFS